MKNKYVQNISCRVRLINGKRTLYGEAKCFELNETAFQIWNMLEDEKSLDEVIDELLQKNKESRDVIENDIKIFIEQLEKNKMLVKV